MSSFTSARKVNIVVCTMCDWLETLHILHEVISGILRHGSSGQDLTSTKLLIGV